MLVLTRKSGEKIRVGDHIVISVLEIKGSHVKVGVDAPAGICVHRDEIYFRIQQENLLASGVEADDFTAAANLCDVAKK